MASAAIGRKVLRVDLAPLHVQYFRRDGGNPGFDPGALDVAQVIALEQRGQLIQGIFGAAIQPRGLGVGLAGAGGVTRQFTGPGVVGLE